MWMYDTFECICDYIKPRKKKVFMKVSNTIVMLSDGSYLEVGREDAAKLTNDIIYKYCFIKFGVLTKDMQIFRPLKDGTYEVYSY